MADQIVLAFTVSTEGTGYTPAQAAAKLAAVPLYANPQTDPVLGQLFSLTVASDATAVDGPGATRTLKLNMTAAAGAPFAPPPLPCRPVGPVPPAPPVPPTLDGELQDAAPARPAPPNPPPQPPYALVDASTQQTIALATGAAAGAYSSAEVVPARQVVVGVAVDLASPGTAVYPAGTTVVVGQPAPGAPSAFTPSPVDATVAALTRVFQATVPVAGKPVQATVSAPGGGGGSASVSATVALAVPVPAGPGARAVSLSYLDSTGAGPFTVVTALTGKLPAPVALAGGSVDVAVVTDLHVASTGAFENSVGQVTLAELTAPTAVVHPNAGLAEQQDAAQLLLGRALVYLPPSYFALTQQGAASPALAGDFLVSTGSPVVWARADQTGALAAGNTVVFAAQPGVPYTVQSVTPKIVTLTAPYTGLDASKVDANNSPRPTNQTANADKQPTGAVRVSPSPAAPPSDAALATPLGEFRGTVGQLPVPVTVSGMFARTLSLALSAPVRAAPVAFA